MQVSNSTHVVASGCVGRIHALCSEMLTKPHVEHGFFSVITSCRKEFRNLRNNFFRDSKWKCFSIPATGADGEKLHYCMLFPLVHRIEVKEDGMRLVYMGDIQNFISGWHSLDAETQEALSTPHAEKTDRHGELIVALIEGTEND